MIFAFALMNTQAVTLRFFLGQVWEMPMILVLLLFFALGAAVGILACVSRLLSQRREIQRLARALRAGERPRPAGLVAPWTSTSTSSLCAVRIRAVLSA